MKSRDVSVSYLLLLLGAATLTLAFTASTRIWDFMDFFPRGLLFLAWILAPFALLTLNTWAVARFLPPGGSRVFRTGTLIFLAAGAVIYGRTPFASPGERMDVNLVFLFGPLTHFTAVAGVTVGYLARGVQGAFESRDR